MPVIGLLEIRSPETIAERLRAFHQGLKETGYVEGENIAIDYRWAEQMERFTELAAELVRRQVAVITTVGGFATALAAKGATTTILIVFSVFDDPVQARSCRQPRAAGWQPDGHQSSKYGVDGKAARAAARNAAEGFPYRGARQPSQYR